MIRSLKNQYAGIFTSRTMRSLSLQLSANVLNSIIGFMTSVLVLRYLDKEIIGVTYALISIFMIVGQIGDMGFSNTFIKISSFHYIDDKFKSLQFFNAAFKLKIIVCLALMIIGLPLARLIAKWTFGEPVYVNWVRWILIISGIQIMSGYGTSALQIEGKFFSLSVSKVVPGFLKMLLIAIVIWLGAANLTWILWAFALVPIGTFIITFFYTDKKPLYKIKSTSEQRSELLHVSKWVAISVVANAIIGQLDVLMTSSMVGVDELNKLLGGQKLASVFIILSISLVTVLLPKVASMKSKKELNYYLRKTTKIIFPLAIVSLALLPLSSFLIPFVLGDKYKSSVMIFNILMVGNIISMASTPIGLILYNLNKEPMFALMNILQLIFNIAGNYFFIHPYGAMGAAWITTLSKLIAVFMIYYYLWKEGVLHYREENEYS